jgi:hypothetical protein
MKKGNKPHEIHEKNIEEQGAEKSEIAARIRPEHLPEKIIQTLDHNLGEGLGATGDFLHAPGCPQRKANQHTAHKNAHDRRNPVFKGYAENRIMIVLKKLFGVSAA